MLEVDRQSGGFTPHAPLNRVHPVKFTPVIAKRISLGYPQGVQPGWNPWGYFTGACNSNIRFFKKLHQLSVSGAFLRLFNVP